MGANNNEFISSGISGRAHKTVKNLAKSNNSTKIG